MYQFRFDLCVYGHMYGSLVRLVDGHPILCWCSEGVLGGIMGHLRGILGRPAGDVGSLRRANGGPKR